MQFFIKTFLFCDDHTITSDYDFIWWFKKWPKTLQSSSSHGHVEWPSLKILQTVQAATTVLQQHSKSPVFQGAHSGASFARGNMFSLCNKGYMLVI